MRKIGALIVAAGIGLTALATTAPAQAQNAQFGVYFGTPFYEPYYGPSPRYSGPRYGRYEPRYNRYRERYGRHSRPEYRGGWAAHVDWCNDRYRSYDQSRNAYRGYDGRWHTCNSPFS